MNKIEQLRHLSRKLVRELGMLQLNQPNSNRTPGHWHALVEISKDPKITISQLGHLLLISTSSISRIIKSLAKEGLVELKEGQNKKEKAIDLTEAGYAALKEVDSFSENKVAGAFEFLTEKDIVQIVDSIDKYSNALEKSRLQKEQVKIATLSTSRTIRQQIVRMMEDIQIKEFGIPITPEINICVLKAEHTFYFNNSYNFWYATDDQG